MRIKRSGARRNQTPVVLTDKKLSFRRRYAGHEVWSTKVDQVTVRTSGSIDDSTYNYDISISLEELIECLQHGVDSRCVDPRARALASALIAALSEFLRLEHKRDVD